MASQPARDDVSLAERGAVMMARTCVSRRGDGVWVAPGLHAGAETPSPSTRRDGRMSRCRDAIDAVDASPKVHRTPPQTLIVVINPQMSHAIGHHDLLPS